MNVIVNKDPQQDVVSVELNEVDYERVRQALQYVIEVAAFKEVWEHRPAIELLDEFIKGLKVVST